MKYIVRVGVLWAMVLSSQAFCARDSWLSPSPCTINVVSSPAFRGHISYPVAPPQLLAPEQTCTVLRNHVENLHATLVGNCLAFYDLRDVAQSSVNGLDFVCASEKRYINAVGAQLRQQEAGRPKRMVSAPVLQSRGQYIEKESLHYCEQAQRARQMLPELHNRFIWAKAQIAEVQRHHERSLKEASRLMEEVRQYVHTCETQQRYLAEVSTFSRDAYQNFCQARADWGEAQKLESICETRLRGVPYAVQFQRGLRRVYPGRTHLVTDPINWRTIESTFSPDMPQRKPTQILSHVSSDADLWWEEPLQEPSIVSACQKVRSPRSRSSSRAESPGRRHCQACERDIFRGENLRG